MNPIFSNALLKDKKIIQAINIEGELIGFKDDISKIPQAEILKAYKIMNLSRNYELKAFQWQRQGKMLTFPPAMGQEAIQVAIGANMRLGQDWFVSSYRDNAVWLYLKRPLQDIFYYWCGNEKGSTYPKTNKVLPVNVLIGTQFSHATGIALANKIRKEDSITFTTIGDGGTSSGEFYASMNFAATLKLPVVFVIQNNQWAISTSLASQTACNTLAQKAIATGIPFYMVDGNDFFASYLVMKWAVKYVKEHQSPILIEAVTYRLGPHTTADDPTIYRTESYHEIQKKNDPLIRLQKYLIKNHLWSEEQQNDLDQEQISYITEQFNIVLENNTTTLAEVFNHTFATNDIHLQEQHEGLQKFFAEKGIA